MFHNATLENDGFELERTSDGRVLAPPSVGHDVRRDPDHPDMRSPVRAEPKEEGTPVRPRRLTTMGDQQFASSYEGSGHQTHPVQPDVVLPGAVEPTDPTAPPADPPSP